MKIKAKIFRYNPEKDDAGQLKEYEIRVEPGMSVLALLHQVHDEQDGTLAYRYSCRGAICGTCAVRINGTSRLACKTQVKDLLEESNEIAIEPLNNLKVVKDLVVDHHSYFEKLKQTNPWLHREKEMPDERMHYEDHLQKMQLDQLNRAADCIKCASCYSDCPKVSEMPTFIGPATAIQIYKQMFDPRDANLDERIEDAASDNGVFACDKYANCVKVCPKDCRPLRAITFIQNKINEQRTS